MSFEALDPAILAALPSGSSILSVSAHGKTRWSTGFRVDVEVDGEEEEYFLKVIERSDRIGMARAEYEGQKALSAVIPDNVAPPTAWSPLEKDSSKAFFLTRFRNLRDGSPPAVQLLAVLKKLHQTSASPTGMFGFPVPTYLGPPPMINDWTDSWEEYYGRQLRADVSFAQQAYGEDGELASLTEEFIEKVVARLLRPLQTGGRSIKPALCHGDLWDGNVQIDVDTKQPVIFDAVCFYGHNEIDLQCMGDPRYVLGMDFIDLYKNEVGASEPKEDFYDRHDVYAIRVDIVTAALFPKWANLLEKSKEKMRQMISKYPNGFEGFKETV